MKVTILGAGAMGSALTIPLCDNGHEVSLWGTKYDEKFLNVILEGRVHPRIDIALPKGIKVFPSEQLKNSMEGSKIVVISVNSKGILSIAKEIAHLVKGDIILMVIAKGLLIKFGEILTVEQGLKSELPQDVRETIPIVSVGGPSIARELAHRSMTAVVYASKNVDAAKIAKKTFQTSYYRIKVSSDIRGLGVCTALKNVYSILLGWLEGFGEKHGIKTISNTKAIVFLQILREIKNVVLAVGGDPETTMGLAGLGDLITTSATGRNGMFGKLLGRELSSTEALEELKKKGVGVVEGYETADKAYKFVKQLEKNGKIRVDNLFLLKEIYSILYENKSAKRVSEELTEFKYSGLRS